MNDHRNSLLKCKATRRDGKRCQGRAIAEDHMCFSHSRYHAKARKEGSSRGGLALQRKLRQADLGNIDLSDSAGVEAALVKFAVALAQGRVAESTARTFAGLVTKLSELRDWKKIEQELDEAGD